MTVIHVIRAAGTDGFRLVADWDDGSQTDLPGWFGGQQEAVDAAREDYPDSEISGLTADEGGWDNWLVDDWLYDPAHNEIDADTTDDELKALAEQYEADAKRGRVMLDGDVLDYLREVRTDAIADAMEN